MHTVWRIAIFLNRNIISNCTHTLEKDMHLSFISMPCIIQITIQITIQIKSNQKVFINMYKQVHRVYKCKVVNSIYIYIYIYVYKHNITC